MDMVVRLIEKGARVFRINFSHGTFDEFGRLLAMVRQAGEETHNPVGVLGDLSGPKIRLGRVAAAGIELKAGDTVALQQQPVVSEAAGAGETIIFSTTMPGALAEIEAGQRIFIDDGAVRMLAVDKIESEGNTTLISQVTVGGAVSTGKGINLPDSQLSLPSLTPYDLKCLDWAVEQDIDYLALSFVRRAADLQQLRSALAERRASREQPIPIIAKIEKPQALDDLDAIVREADAVMVARGDLGVEMDLAEVPVIQKRIIRLAHAHGRPVIVATQMLQSMIRNPVPTRAEVSDVANAIFDGADAVMLSGETAIGDYPDRAVAMMARVATAALGQVVRDDARAVPGPSREMGESPYRTAALARGVATVVRDLGAKLVVTWSQRGGGARYLSRNRLGVPVIAACSDMAVLRRMSILYGVVPVLMSRPDSRSAFSEQVDELVTRSGWVSFGDPIVLVAGEPLGVAGVTNSLWIRYVGDAGASP